MEKLEKVSCNQIQRARNIREWKGHSEALTGININVDSV